MEFNQVDILKEQLCQNPKNEYRQLFALQTTLLKNIKKRILVLSLGLLIGWSNYTFRIHLFYPKHVYSFNNFIKISSSGTQLQIYSSIEIYSLNQELLKGYVL